MPLPIINRQHTRIDATDRAAGRVAAEIALVLMGKHRPTYERHIDSGDFVTVENASKLKFTGRKLVQKDYYRHTQYPGGLKTTPLKKVFDAQPEKVIYKAVYGMLPKNKLRAGMLKRLTIKA
jgi:large subunit ribosomal protein L13